MLLSEKANPIDHLLRACTRGIEPAREPRVLLLQKLHALRGHDSLHSGRLQVLDARLRLQRPTAERGELVTEMLHELLQLRKCGNIRPYAFGHPVLPLKR